MPSEQLAPMSRAKLGAAYVRIKRYVEAAGYGDEIDWQAHVHFEDVGEAEFLRESAWVVLSSGFRESVVRKCFDKVSDAFLGWEDARLIHSRRKECVNAAVRVFGNRRKLEAITQIVEKVAREGVEAIKEGIRAQGVDYLGRLPYIGPVTSYHLAKNLGLGVVKPDRHLVRMATASGHHTVVEMCSKIAEEVGDSLPVVDIVLWRYATINVEYLTDFNVGE
ncbi:MAG: hypothetical protein OXI33_07700 [Chloroflexota bacterium]|nr:hypothetical protein [Chloroflexota bacterium]